MDVALVAAVRMVHPMVRHGAAMARHAVPMTGRLPVRKVQAPRASAETD